MLQKWNFVVSVDGSDLKSEGYATTFDDDTTASGVSAKTPGIVGCSLPTGRVESTNDSGFPKMPWFTVVKVFYPKTGKFLYCPLIDEGPAWKAEAGTGKPGSAMIDLTPAAAKLLGMKDNDKVVIRIMKDQIWRKEQVIYFSELYQKIEE